MMFPFVKYSDNTEVVFSEIRKKENGEEYILVCFERPTEKGFDTVIFELPSYEIVKNDGEYTAQEIENFKKVVERGAPFFFKSAKEGGIASA
jgi:hypothetical protein